MITAASFADAVGRKALAEGVGVQATAVSNAVVRGWFPSSWFLVAQALAERAGVECPPDLFGMKDVPPNVKEVVDVQGDAA